MRIEIVMIAALAIVLLSSAITITTSVFAQLPPSAAPEKWNREETLNALSQGGSVGEAINATLSSNNTAVATNATHSPQRLEIQRLQSEDPSFKAFEDIFINCSDSVVFGNGTLSHFQCMQSMQQGIDKWCGIEGYHIVKCEYSQAVLGLYMGLSFTFQRQ